MVYPHGERISAPDSIGREVGRRLESSYDVQYYDWDSRRRIEPKAGDVLVGHPHPTPGTCFSASARSPLWGRKIMLCPFNHDPSQVGFLDRVIPHVDAYLAITGSYWFDSIERSAFAHWRPKMVHVDMAIDPVRYPPIKSAFNPMGARSFVYIGHSGWQKNTRYLGELAKAMPDALFDWIGSGDDSIPGLNRLGPMDFLTAEAREIVAGHDFLITVGLFDANPTTVLEAMGWGLIPVCTPQSGYYRNPGVVNVPANDAAGAVSVLEELNHADETVLVQMQRENRDQIASHFNWDRFTAQVTAEIESTETRPMGRETMRRRMALRWSEVTSPYSPIGLDAIGRTLGRLRRSR